MSVMSVTWALFRFSALLEKYDLDYILAKEDQLLKFTSKSWYFGIIKDLPREFLIDNSSMIVEFPENKTEEITAGAYLLSTAEILNSV